eukprot:12975853-Alexandrium_andersonii.AAC.1
MVWGCQRFGQVQCFSGLGRQCYESAGPACDAVRMLERSWGARGISEGSAMEGPRGFLVNSQHVRGSPRSRGKPG